MQCNLSECLKEIKSYMDKDIPVCFSGTPCQVTGLKCFLKRDYDNLFTVDLVCKGVASPAVF